MDFTSNNISLPPMLNCFSKIVDPRVGGRTDHTAEEIISLSICAIISGARHWTQVERFGHVHIKWLKKFLALPAGIPSHDTIGRFWAALNPSSFMICFHEWIKSFANLSDNQIIAIDGKTSRATHSRDNGLKPAHIVNAFETHSNLTISQVRVPDKTNEIKAIPILINEMDVQGKLITVDAMGCQRGIAKLLKNKGADYVFSVKMNQGKLCKKINYMFSKAEEYNYNAMVFRQTETKDIGHGRIEEREYTVLPQCYNDKLKKHWPGLQTFIMVKRTRIKGNEETVTIHYFISSLPMKCFQKIAKAIRYHWHIENNCHWQLDNTFLEDRCTARVGYASENFSLLRKFVLNLLKIKRKGKLSFEAMRLEAAWDKRYLGRLIGL